MDLIDVTEKIKEKIRELDDQRNLLEEYSQTKAVTSAEYDKELAKTIILLKNGKEFDLDGVKILNPLTTITEKIAKGICWEQALNKDIAESKYKNQTELIEIIKAQLNGYQTIQRHLSHI